MFEGFVVANDCAVQMPIAVAMMAHVELKRFAESGRLKPVFEQWFRKLFENAWLGGNFARFGCRIRCQFRGGFCALG